MRCCRSQTSNIGEKQAITSQRSRTNSLCFTVGRCRLKAVLSYLARTPDRRDARWMHKIGNRPVVACILLGHDMGWPHRPLCRFLLDAVSHVRVRLWRLGAFRR